MATHKWIDRICAAAAALSLLLVLVFMEGEALGIQRAASALGYEDRLFDTGRVHTIDIVMDGWEEFLSECEDEVYRMCSVVIDGESCRNVGIRAKGNTSLSAVSAMDSSRYSFKIEFDHYDSAGSYYGLDKLSLNNAIQDTTYMKDYLTYRLMASFGAAAPLCSYAWITVNGQDWGLYLAVEGVEDAFLQRNYGGERVALYKPDSTSLGGGPGNGRDFDFQASADGRAEDSGLSVPDFSADLPAGEAPAEPPSPGGGAQRSDTPGGMGSSDVKLQYIDDDPASYPNIFQNAKTEVTEADEARLIRSLKALSAGENLEAVLDIEAVLRYFVVHNFVCNGDSYTGDMVHNYYLCEQEGRLTMIPWDYNLAFGTFQASDATGTVNTPLDTPVSGGTGDRPMVDWIFSDAVYQEQYHQLFAEFLANTDFSGLIEEAAALIAPYVEQDPTGFYTYEEFEAGVAALKEFCLLRSLSAAGQLAGDIPATAAGQAEDPSSLVDASGLNLADMGTMTGGGGGGIFQGGLGNGLPSFGEGQMAGPGAAGPSEIPGDLGQRDPSEEAMRPGQPGAPDQREPPEGAGNLERSDPFGQQGRLGEPEEPDTGGILLGASLAVLLAGLGAAGLFRRRRRRKG